MKKLLMGILALTLALSFTACGEDSKKDTDKEETKQTETKKEDKKVDKKDAAEETVKAFMDALCKFDFKKMENYVDGELTEEFAQYDLASLKSELMSNMPEDIAPMKSYIEDLFDSAIDDMLSSISYQITSVEEDGDDIKVCLDLTTPDFGLLETAFEDALAAPEVEEETMALITEAMESGELTEGSSEQDILDYIMPKVFDMAKDIVADEIKNAEKTTEEGEFILTEVDGKWLINTEKSDL